MCHRVSFYCTSAYHLCFNEKKCIVSWEEEYTWPSPYLKNRIRCRTRTEHFLVSWKTLVSCDLNPTTLRIKNSRQLNKKVSHSSNAPDSTAIIIKKLKNSTVRYLCIPYEAAGNDSFSTSILFVAACRCYFRLLFHRIRQSIPSHIVRLFFLSKF